MESLSGAKVCELVGFYILDTLKKEKMFSNSTFEYYVGLTIIDNLPGPSLEVKVKKLRRV